MCQNVRNAAVNADVKWYSAKRLAEMGIRGLPTSQRRIHDVARREKWPTREARSRGGRRGIRAEYQPPADVQLQIDEIEARNRGPHAGKDRAAYSPLGEDFVMVPRYDVAGSAGGGSLIHSEQIVDHLAFRADWVMNALGVSRKDLVLISVKGDSMQPTLSEGDLILVDTGVREFEDSAIYVLRKGEGLFVKRVHHKLDGTIIVKSDNERYEPEIYSPEAAPSVQVVGRVVWVGRRL